MRTHDTINDESRIEKKGENGRRSVHDYNKKKKRGRGVKPRSKNGACRNHNNLGLVLSTTASCVALGSVASASPSIPSDRVFVDPWRRKEVPIAPPNIDQCAGGCRSGPLFPPRGGRAMAMDSLLALRGGTGKSSEDFYRILGVEKTATAQEIKKAYRRKAVQTHPDKRADGDRTEFDRVAKAYDVLSDDNKRALYDRYGDAGLEMGGGGSAGAGGGARGFASSSSFQEEILKSFFGMGPSSFGGAGGSGGDPFSSFRRQQPARQRNVRYQLEVSLEDMYRGTTKVVSMSLPSSNGRRRSSASPATKRVEVPIPAGSYDGQKVVLSGEIDSLPGVSPGDAVFVLVQRSHRVFSRKNADLAVEMEISLKEAICGVRRKIVHLDGRVITVTTVSSDGQSNDVLINRDVRVVEGEGMPVRSADGRTHMRGNLFVQFKVRMPSGAGTGAGSSVGERQRSSGKNSLTENEREQLSMLLEKLESTSVGATPSFDAEQRKSRKTKDKGLGKDENVKRLAPATASDFGKTQIDRSGGGGIHDETTEEDEDNAYQRGNYGQHPFESMRQQFFYSGGRPGGSSASSFFSSNPNYGNNNEGEGDVQCQQM